ncbi:MAG TPA: hypothetical protein VMN36_19280 [Verrucomicrobiales bacterium]|nr:hypothetical protein [Verrucomicrobiales bacterium]
MHGQVKRGCLLAITLLAAAICTGACLLYFYFIPKKLRFDSSAIALKLEDGLAQYRSENGVYPPGDGSAVFAALLGENARNRAYIDPRFREQASPAGEITDVWGRAFRFENLPEGPPRILSAGRNGVFGDEDDIDSSLARGLVRQPDPAPAQP